MDLESKGEFEMMSFDRKWFANCVTAGLLLCAVLLTAVGDADAARRGVSVSGQMASAADILRDVAEQAKIQLVMTAGVDTVVSKITVSIRNRPWDEVMRQVAAKAGLYIWIEGDCAVVSKDKLGAQPRLSLVPEVSPPTKVTLNYERAAMEVVLEKIASEAGISILIMPGKGEDLIAAKLPGRRTISLNVRNVHWRKALELVARSAGCRVETVADGMYAVSSLSVVIKAVNRPIQDVINDISEQSGINVVVSPKVKGNVTVNLDGVPWAEALDAIVTSLGLSWRQYRENTVIVTGEPMELTTAIGFYDINYLPFERVRGALGAMIGIKEAWEMLGGGEPKPPFVLMLKLEPHMLRAMESFLAKYDRPAPGTPIEFDLSYLQITVDTTGGILEYDSNMQDVQKMLFYRKFRRAIAPVLSEQGETSFIPIVDKVMVKDVPRNLTYVEQIVLKTFPPIETPELGEQLVGKEYTISISDAGDIVKVLRAQVKPGLNVKAKGAKAIVVSATVREHKRVQEILAAYDVDVVRKEYNVLYKSIDSLIPLLRSRLSPLAVIETDPLTKTVIIEAPMPDQVYTEKFMKVQDVPAADAISVKVFKLNFAKADELAAILKEFLESTTKLLAKIEPIPSPDADTSAPTGVPDSDTGDGSDPLSNKIVTMSQSTFAAKIEAVVIADVSTNSLIVTASGADMPKIQDLIEKLDGEPRQVLIIGRIIETTVHDFSDIGLDISLAGGISGASVPTTIPFDKRQIKLYDDIVPGKHPFEIGTGEDHEYPASSLFAYPDADLFRQFGLLSFANLGATLSLLETMGNTKLISSPRIVIVDNNTATFQVSESREYRKRGSVTTGDGGQVAYEYEYAVAEDKISIEVTPQITPNGKILMTLKPEVVTFIEFDEIMNFDGTVDKLPRQVSRSTETKVIVDDGMTLVLAGLVSDWSRNSDTQVPFLGKIPLLGRLFRKEIDEQSTRNLVFFFTPIIMKDDGSHVREIAKVKTSYGKLGEIEKTEIVEWDREAAETPRKRTHASVRPAVKVTNKPKRDRRERR